MARNDRPHFLYSFATSAIVEGVNFLRDHVGGPNGSLYGNALRTHFEVSTAGSGDANVINDNDQDWVPRNTPSDASLLSDMCAAFVDTTIRVVNDIMEGRIEDSGLAAQPSDWMASVRSAVDFDAKLDHIFGRRRRMTDVFFNEPGRMAIVTRLDLHACTMLLRDAASSSSSSSAVRDCWSSSVAVTGAVMANAGTVLGLPRDWANDADLELVGSFLRADAYGEENDGAAARRMVLLRPNQYLGHHRHPATGRASLATMTPMAERFLGLLQELRSRLSHMRTRRQQWAYVKGAVIDVVRAFGEMCGDAWEEMGERRRSPTWPGEGGESSDTSSNMTATGHLPGHDFDVRPLTPYWTVRVGALNTMKLAAEVLRAWGEQDADDVKFASLLKWRRDEVYEAALSARIEARRQKRADRERKWSRRDSNDSTGLAASMSEFISLSPLSNMARSSGLAEKSKALAGETLELAARIDSDIRAEIRENEETLQMIGPMRAIDALSKSTAVSSLANASMNVLGNVMSLARTVRTTAATHAAPMEGAVNVGRREDAGFAGGSDDGGGGGREKDSSTFAVGGAFDGPAKPSQPASGHHRLSGLSEVTEEAEDEAERDIELETEAGQRALERGDGDAPSGQAAEIYRQRQEEERVRLVEERQLEEARIQASEREEDVEAARLEASALSEALANGGVFQKQVVEMDRLVGEYVIETTDTLGTMMLARLSGYACGGIGMAADDMDMAAWWTRSAACGALEVASPVLLGALKSGWLCRLSLSPVMHPELFALVWSALATKIDVYVYERVVLGQTFTAMGVRQLAHDAAQLEAVMKVEGQGVGQDGDEEVSGSVALPLVNDALVVLGWSPEERGAIVEALGQLSLGDEDVASWPCRWVSSGGGGGGGGGDELIQMHDMLVTRGVSVLHPEHALHISSQRI